MEIFIVLLVLISPYLSLLVALLGYVFQPTREKLWLFLLVSFVFVSGYCINTTYENDIDRYYAILDSCKYLSLSKTILHLNNGLYFENFLFWFYSHLGVYQLMPAVSSAVVFGIGAYVAGDSARRTNNFNILWLIIIFQLLTVPIFNIASNVRNVLAFSLIMLGAYRDLVGKNRGVLTLLLYILPCFLHGTGIILVGLRLIVPLVSRFPLVCVFFVGVVSQLIGFAYTHILSFVANEGVVGTIIRKVIAKSYSYMLGTNDFSKIMVNSRFDLLNRPITFLIAIIIAVFSYRVIRHNSEYKNVATYCLLLCIIVLSCGIFTTPAFWRFAVAMTIMFSPVICATKKSLTRMKTLENFLCFCLCIAAFSKFAITIPYLSSRTDMMQHFVDTAVTNIYFISLYIMSAAVGF